MSCSNQKKRQKQKNDTFLAILHHCVRYSSASERQSAALSKSQFCTQRRIRRRKSSRFCSLVQEVLGSRHFYEKGNAEKQQKYVRPFFCYGMFVAKKSFFVEKYSEIFAYLFLSKVQVELRTFFQEQSTFKIEAKKGFKKSCLS